MGIWVFYYLRFTDYAGIGLIETVLILTMTIAEIPTGAIADLLGKKITLTVAFLLMAFGNIFMGLTPNFPILVISVFIAGLGGTFESGTSEALIYDSLLETKEEHTFDKVIANIKSIHLLAPAVTGIIGGFLYALNFRLPMLASGFTYGIAFIITFFLHEPSIDSEKFSWRNYILQTKQGIKQLSQTIETKKITIFLLSVGLIVVITSEMLNDFLAVEFSFTPQELAIFWSICYLVSAVMSQLTPKFIKQFGLKKTVFGLGIIIAVSLIVSPIAGLILGGFTLFVRNGFGAIFENASSITINRFTLSKYRATTISTFNMFKNIPYVLTAYLFGSLANIYSAKTSALFLGILLLTFILLQINSIKRLRKPS
ncbi:MFS transporter [Candidatus Beckwithbacteria bacterium]|nr:MFS transporter [Candidatus Beckwithbacteria bacterium]